MTEERKQELKQLLAEAKANLVILFGCRRALTLPTEVYRKCLQKHWASYGIDFFSFWFPSLFMPYIEDKTTESKLFNFIREELALLIDRGYIVSVTYAVESKPTNTSRLFPIQVCSPHLYSILTRLLEITIGKGIEEAISTLDRFSCPKGVHGLFRHIVLLEGINLQKPVQVVKGVQLIPLPFGESPEELTQYLPGFLDDNSGHLPMPIDKALLIIDCPGFSIFYKPSTNSSSPPGMPNTNLPYDAPPFHFENHTAKFPNFNVNDFCNTFCQALSLVCDSLVQIRHKRWFCEEDKSFNETRDAIGMVGDLSSVRGYGTEGDIKEAKELYDILCKNSDIREKLRIPIDRWVKSKAGEEPNDKIVDLGIALEALYVTRKDKIERQLCYRGSRYLEEDEKLWEDREAEFKAIYNYRSGVLHNRELDEEVTIGKQTVPISDLVPRAEDLCRRSILKIMKAGKYPDWKTLRQNIKAKQGKGTVCPK